MKFPTSSLVTPTYNWPNALELLLLSIKNQSVYPDEVIIADDGSNIDTKLLIEKFQKDFPVPLLHVWHEDQGNRKPVIMNKAIAKAQYDYIIEIDGDIILHKDFVKDHLTYAKNGFYLFGSRVNIQEKILQKIFQNKITTFHFLSKSIKKRTRTLRLPVYMRFAKIHNKISKKLRGCNMSFWRKDFIEVNGFNEDMKGWGVDDSELVQRFHNIGIKGMRLKQVGIAYHIWHKEQDKANVHLNYAIEDNVREKQIKFTEKGINQYL